MTSDNRITDNRAALISDEQLRSLLRESVTKAGHNPWFTRRVLNRLPARRERGSAWAVLLYAAALVVCVGLWWYMLSSADIMVITLGDLVKGLVLIVVTFALVASIVHTAVTSPS